MTGPSNDKPQAGSRGNLIPRLARRNGPLRPVQNATNCLVASIGS